MTIEEALYAYLSGFPGLSALVVNRIYPLVMPQNVIFPAIRYQRIDTPREYSRDGYSGLAHPRFQFSCFDTSFESAKAVAKQVREALKSYAGTMGGAGGVSVRGTVLLDEVDSYESEPKIFHTAVDVLVWHEE